MVEVARVTFILYIAAAASLALAYRALRGVEAPAGQAARAGLSQMDVPTRTSRPSWPRYLTRRRGP